MGTAIIFLRSGVTLANVFGCPAPKKKEVQKLSLNEFMNDNCEYPPPPPGRTPPFFSPFSEQRLIPSAAFGGGGSNWADEVEETYGKSHPAVVKYRFLPFHLSHP